VFKVCFISDELIEFRDEFVFFLSVESGYFIEFLVECTGEFFVSGGGGVCEEGL
jgi:hypothetical protein